MTNAHNWAIVLLVTGVVLVGEGGIAAGGGGERVTDVITVTEN